MLRVALGLEDTLSASLTYEEWEALMDEAKRQCVLGIAYEGLRRLPREQRPCIEQMFLWKKVYDYIDEENVKMNAMCHKICSIFKSEGINACILKGQAIATYYPWPQARQSGDIDAWMEGGRDKVVKYIQQHFPKTEPPHSHHISTSLKGSIRFEVHFLPTILFDPFANKRFLRWLDNVEKRQWGVTATTAQGEEINLPTWEFDAVFIPLHFFHHWLINGMGLKQIFDIYFLLKYRPKLDKSSPLCDGQTDPMAVLAELGMKDFVAALMYMMQKLFDLPDECLLCAPDAKLGEQFIADVLSPAKVAGNKFITGEYHDENILSKCLRSTMRIFSVYKFAKREALWDIPTNIYNILKYK